MLHPPPARGSPETRAHAHQKSFTTHSSAAACGQQRPSRAAQHRHTAPEFRVLPSLLAPSETGHAELSGRAHCAARRGSVCRNGVEFPRFSGHCAKPKPVSPAFRHRSARWRRSTERRTETRSGRAGGDRSQGNASVRSGADICARPARNIPRIPCVITQELHQEKRLAAQGTRKPLICWWPRAELNHRHKDFQSSALPTELLGQVADYTKNSSSGRRFTKPCRRTIAAWPAVSCCIQPAKNARNSRSVPTEASSAR